MTRFFRFRLLLLLVANGISFFSLATHADTARNIKIKIDPESFIIIHGKTNVNHFQCRYDELSPGKTLTLNLFVEDQCLMFENATLSLETHNFDCGNKMMNHDFKDLLKADKYPQIEIDIQCINLGNKAFKAVPVKKTDRSAIVHTNFKIAGRENEYPIPIEIQENDRKRIYTGEMKIDIRDFGLEPPKKMMGLVVVEEIIYIEFYLVVSLVNP